jgi:hypothetical protein
VPYQRRGQLQGFGGGLPVVQRTGAPRQSLRRSLLRTDRVGCYCADTFKVLYWSMYGDGC